jgi:hypothetical protein
LIARSQLWRRAHPRAVGAVLEAGGALVGVVGVVGVEVALGVYFSSWVMREHPP